MYLFFTTVSYFADLKSVSLISDLFFFLISNFDLMSVKEVLQTANSKSSLDFKNEIILRKNFKSWESSLGDVLFVVDIHELLVDIFSVSVG